MKETKTVTRNGLGSPPFGYRYDKSSKQYFPKPDEVEVVKETFKLALGGWSFRDITDELNRKGYKAKYNARWSYGNLRYILKDDRIWLYAGYDKNMNRIVNLPPIITKKMAKKLIAKEIIKKAESRPRKRINLLPGLKIAHCGFCGALVKSSTSKSDYSILHYYRCTNKTINGVDACKSAMWHQDEINNLVIVDMVVQAEREKAIKKWIPDFAKLKEAKLKKEVYKLDKEIAEVLSKIPYAKDDDETKHLKKLKGQLEKLRTELHLQADNPVAYDSSELKSVNNAKIERQRELITKYIEKITLYDNYLTVQYRFPVDAKLNDTVKLKFK